MNNQMTTPLKLLLVAGARPNFMKIAPVIRAIKARAEQFEYVLVHTGQHYDEGMSEIFFRDLGIPPPDHHLNVGSGSHAEQTARIMVLFEPVLRREDPKCVLVFGDVNSTLACSIVAKKCGYPVAHVEAGLRSGDLSMPEEINRIVTDSISDYFFVTEDSGIAHLRDEGKSSSRIFLTGHVMVDNLLYEVAKIETESSEPSQGESLVPLDSPFGVVTLHRPSNVDDQQTLRGIVEALGTVATKLPLVFPVHPRTKASLERFDIPLPDGIRPTKPLGYQDFLRIWRKARLVLTDSGGLQEETTALGIPCLTIRENTERPITVDQGTNVLVGTSPEKIVSSAFEALSQAAGASPPPRPAMWDGKSSDRILDALLAQL